jgi:hypothetical protein
MQVVVVEIKILIQVLIEVVLVVAEVVLHLHQVILTGMVLMQELMDMVAEEDLVNILLELVVQVDLEL